MTEIILASLGVVILAIMGWLIFLTKKYRYISKKAELLFSGKTPGNLSETLKNYLTDVKTVEDHCFELDKEIKRIKKIAEAGLHKVGFVRYNPFGDVGGNQSFSLCLLDKKDNGFVISSIHSREGTRVYSKTVSQGGSEYNLSEEEKKAINLALKK